MLPQISVIILNYNGCRWLERCFQSLREQTLFDRIEVITADNLSSDGSDDYARLQMESWEHGRFLQNGENLGYCEGNNRAAAQARGEFLFFLNNDTWLESDCLQQLMEQVDRTEANAATPIMLNYEDDSVQSVGGEGFDLFGLMSYGRAHEVVRDIFVAGGCSFLIRRKDFVELGGFDPAIFMYGDEYDLSWRNWVAGGRSIIVPQARLHHWGAGATSTQESDTPKSSFTKRFYTNRNNLIVVFKNAQHILLLLGLGQLLLLVVEAVASLIALRNRAYVQRAYLDAIRDCWRLRHHIRSERLRIRGMRKKSDWAMLRFFRVRLNRWDELLNILRRGFPRIMDK